MLAKAELHVHHEGTAPPSLIKQIAERNKLSLPDNLFASDTQFAWKNFLDFLDVYEKASMVIRQPQDYYDMTYSYLKNSAQQGVIYVELLYSPEHAERASGLPSHEHLLAIGDAINDAKEAFGIETSVIMAFVRHYGVEACMKVAKHAVEEKKYFPWITGVNLAGDEANFPPALFVKPYQIAHGEGLGCTAHAGEFAGPQSVWEAINTLPVTRIGHGVRSIEDPSLVQALIHRDITLEVCPTSNIVLGVYPSYEEHPLKKLLASGVKLTLNSDDPPYFGTTIGEEYTLATEKFGLDEPTLLQFTRHAIEASFTDPATQQRLLDRLSP